MESYAEFIIKKRREPKDIILCILSVIAALLLCILIIPIVYLKFPGFVFLIPAVVFGVFFGAYKFISATNIEFEYLVTGGTLDIDKIINKTSRKRVISVSSGEFRLMAPKGSSNLPQESGDMQIIDAASGKADSLVWGLVANKKDKNIMIYFEPSEKMMELFELKFKQKIFTQ